MTDDNDTTTKLIVLIAGLSTIIFFAYLVYKDRNKSILPQQLTLARPRQTELERIEQRLIQFETKLDSLSTIAKVNQQLATQQPTQQNPERTVVSMSKPTQHINTLTKMKTTNTREMFGMQ